MADCLLLIDHENVPYATVSLEQILDKWLTSAIQRGKLSLVGVHSIRVRAYGGWYMGHEASPSRYKAAQFYQQACPSLRQLDQYYFRISFEFADTLLGPFRSHVFNHTISHTVAERNSPPVFTRRHGGVCTETDCEIKKISRWLKRRRACPRPGCPHTFHSQFIRVEQKQVDVHLSVDLGLAISVGSGISIVAVASDDADLQPALLAAAALRQSRVDIAWLRSNTCSLYSDGFLESCGTTIECAW